MTMAFLGPDYMSRAGPVSRAALVRAGPVVIAKLIFVAFNRRAEIPANSNQPG